MLAAARIVDEQVEAEQQLKASLERFEAVVANAPSAISVRDLGHRYTLVNDAFANFRENVNRWCGRSIRGRDLVTRCCGTLATC